MQEISHKANVTNGFAVKFKSKQYSSYEGTIFSGRRIELAFQESVETGHTERSLSPLQF
jgi:hypothetical protein